MTTLAESGAIGVGTAIVLWLAFARKFRLALVAAAPRARRLALALAAGFIATLVQGAVDLIQVVILACWLPFMALALAAAHDGTVDA